MTTSSSSSSRSHALQQLVHRSGLAGSSRKCSMLSLKHKCYTHIGTLSDWLE